VPPAPDNGVVLQQWLWFGVALVAMLVIGYVATIFPKV